MTGNILGVEVPDLTDYVENATFVVVDDICDNGGTFLALGKAIKDVRPDVNLILAVSHGFFGKGLDDLKVYYKQIYCYNLLSKVVKYDDYLMSI